MADGRGYPAYALASPAAAMPFDKLLPSKTSESEGRLRRWKPSPESGALLELCLEGYVEGTSRGLPFAGRDMCINRSEPAPPDPLLCSRLGGGSLPLPVALLARGGGVRLAVRPKPALPESESFTRLGASLSLTDSYQHLARRREEAGWRDQPCECGACLALKSCRYTMYFLYSGVFL